MVRQRWSRCDHRIPRERGSHTSLETSRAGRHNGALVNDRRRDLRKACTTGRGLASREPTRQEHAIQKEAHYLGPKESAQKRGQPLAVLCTSCANGCEGGGARTSVHVVTGKTSSVVNIACRMFGLTRSYPKSASPRILEIPPQRTRRDPTRPKRCFKVAQSLRRQPSSGPNSANSGRCSPNGGLCLARIDRMSEIQLSFGDVRRPKWPMLVMLWQLV